MSAPYSSGGSHRNQGNSRGQNHRETVDCKTVAWIQGIRFQNPLKPELFSDLAKNAAQEINGSAGGKDKNKPSQLRRFYDEIVMWEGKLVADPAKFDDFLPFIRMLNAKAAYAKGRNVVSEHFVCLVEHTLAQVHDAKSMTICKLFWEAFMGFYKSERPSD